MSVVWSLAELEQGPTLRVVEIFHSIQGEGAAIGRAATFVRLAGCNRACEFCDTDFSTFAELTVEEIARIVRELNPRIGSRRAIVVFTGGEPTLQLTRERLAALRAELDAAAFHLETNGSTLDRWGGAGWFERLTVSPKTLEDFATTLRFWERAPNTLPVDLKIVYDGQNLAPFDAAPRSIGRYLQPKAVANDPEATARNIEKTIRYVKENPQWTLSLQLHKTLGLR